MGVSADTVRYSALGPVRNENLDKVKDLVDMSPSGCFHWVTKAQLKTLLQIQDVVIDLAKVWMEHAARTRVAPKDLPDHPSMQLDRWLEIVDKENFDFEM